MDDTGPSPWTGGARARAGRVLGRVLGRFLGLVLQGALRLLARVFAGVRPLPMAQLPGVRHESSACVFFANHNSLADFIVLWSALPRACRRRVRPVAAADHWGRTSWRRFLARDVFRAVLVDRHGAAEAGEGVRAMAEVLRAGDCLLMFPEGTRNMGGAVLQPFRKGLYQLAVACPQAWLVPVWLAGTRRVLPKGALLPVPSLCSVTIGTPLLRGCLEGAQGQEAFLRRAEAALRALSPDERARAEAHARASIPSQDAAFGEQGARAA